MKVTRDTGFQPITITIEAENELIFLYDIADDGQNNDQWNTSAQAFFSSLAKELKKQKELK